MKLYHYRSIDKALLEIKNKSFHFTYRSKLNDPIEGFLEIYWKGDSPAWSGLFKNYICSLCDNITYFYTKATLTDIETNAILLPDKYANVPFQNLLNTISQNYLNIPRIQQMISVLDEKETLVDSKLLLLILRFTHIYALNICFDAMKNKYLLPSDFRSPFSEGSILNESLDKIFPEFIKFLYDQSPKSDLIITLSNTIDDIIGSFLLNQSKISESLSNAELDRLQTGMQLYLNFPAIYVNNAQNYIYPEGYIVCFSSSNNNSSMWGNYADDHKGVCLIYETQSKDSREILSIKSPSVYSSNGNVTYKFIDKIVTPVQYGDEPIKRNFFESLGKLTYKQIKMWLSDERESLLLKNYQSDTWREKYWEDYNKIYHSKLSDWKHEQEYRILFNTFLNSPSEEDLNKEYAQDALTGIIFGMKTSLSDQEKVLAALKKSGFSIENLNFFQAEFEAKNNTLNIRKKLILQ